MVGEWDSVAEKDGAGAGSGVPLSAKDATRQRGEPVGPVSAAIIIADKADVHKSRVQNPKPETFDTHDQVNNASTRSFVRVDAEKKVILMEIDIDTSVSQVGDFFEIYVSRLLIARRAAKFLGCEYHLLVNGARVY